jgi:hypothetical protein
MTLFSSYRAKEGLSIDLTFEVPNKHGFELPLRRLLPLKTAALGSILWGEALFLQGNSSI